jgi:hypothetical protein
VMACHFLSHDIFAEGTEESRDRGEKIRARRAVPLRPRLPAARAMNGEIVFAVWYKSPIPRPHESPRCSRLGAMDNLYGLWIWLGMVAFFAVSLTVIFRLEKRMVWPYGALEAAPYFGDPTGYGTRWVTDAMRAGFLFLGWARDVNGPTYRISYALLVSADRDTLAVIGVGTILKIPFQATWLHTPAMDGRSFYSTDKQTGVQMDLSRNWTNQLALEPSFGKLLQKHREWVQSIRVLPRLFTRDREFAEFRALRDEHFRSMERAGLIRFTNVSATHFHFTLSGAAKTATWSYLLGIVRRLSHGRFPRAA